jgi:hypothetical protein
MTSHSFRGPVLLVLLCGGLLSCSSGTSGGEAPYFPTAKGTAWTFKLTVAPTPSVPAGSSDSVSMQIEQGSSASVTVRSSHSNSPTSYGVQTFEIGDTGIAESSSLVYSAMNDTLTGGSSFSPPELILPSATSPGSTASSTSTDTLEGNGGGLTPFTVTRDIVVNAVESVTVPAGTFSALKVTTHITSTSPISPDAYNVQWYAAGVGHVKIVNYATATPAQTTTWELTSHSP